VSAGMDANGAEADLCSRLMTPMWVVQSLTCESSGRTRQMGMALGHWDLVHLAEVESMLFVAETHCSDPAGRVNDDRKVEILAVMRSACLHPHSPSCCPRRTTFEWWRERWDHLMAESLAIVIEASVIQRQAHVSKVHYR
jgi:hypothetical protein